MKQSFIRIYEPAEKMVHIDAPDYLDCVTLCGKTDWIGEGHGYETTKPVTCWHCKQIAAFCQRHRRLTTKRAASEPRTAPQAMAEPTREEVVEEISRYFGKYPHLCEKLADSVLDLFIKPRGESAREGGK